MNPPFQTGCWNSASRIKNTDFGSFFGTKCRKDVGRLALFARWVFEEKFHSNFASPTAC
jgi:hypothetical protein